MAKKENTINEVATTATATIKKMLPPKTIGETKRTMDACLENLKEELKSASIETELTTAQEENNILALWTGEKSVKLTSIETFVTEKGIKYFRLFFMDSAGVPMPSQFADQLGNIAIRHDQFLNNFIPSMKFIHNMPSTSSPIDVIKFLESEFHVFYFVTKSSLKAWGMSIFTVIDYKATAEKVRGVGV